LPPVTIATLPVRSKFGAIMGLPVLTFFAVKATVVPPLRLQERALGDYR
jgi:hypothetical protein